MSRRMSEYEDVEYESRGRRMRPEADRAASEPTWGGSTAVGEQDDAGQHDEPAHSVFGVRCVRWGERLPPTAALRDVGRQL